MNRKQKTRFIAIFSIVILLGIATSLILYALKQNINLFYTPTQLLKMDVAPEQRLRLGGYVKKNSVHYDASGESVSFIVTDRVNEVLISYQGVLPNLFREGQTVVVTGNWNKQSAKKISDWKLVASEVLAKHDERYMPKPLQNLKKGEGYGT